MIIISNQTIAIKFLDKITSKNVENFIKDHIPENKKKNLTTNEIKELKKNLLEKKLLLIK